VAATVNLTMVHTYFEVGRMIVEHEQHGNEKAEYGKQVLKKLSERLTERLGKGFSQDNLENMRQFYRAYSISETASRKFLLSWSHYLVLMRIENPDERSFYEIETAANTWSFRELKRQYHSSLYERLALSRDKQEVMRLALEGQQIEKPTDILKNPLSLEFLGLEPHSAYSESDLEAAILSKIQHFLLELGKGFLFEARQKRFTFDEKHYFVDLIFYNRLLQCYVLIDLKTEELDHRDLGQMQMYVNFYDRYVKADFEKPSIGILLCKKRNQALVELTLPETANIYASEYSLYLPDKQLLQQKLAEWLLEFEEN
jgi:predicted nuclease of restriction endonuclease-like (RecB) superfamily